MTKELLRVIMGENIRNERTARNITIDDLAYELELTSGFVGLIERGKRGATPFTIYKISELFGISIDNIFARASERLPQGAEEPEQTHREMLKNKILLSFNYLRDNELEFLVRTIKGIKEMNHLYDVD